ncbi:hypothetical protein AB0L81_28165, partial [Streptomyces sp. NPDC052127]
ATDVPEKTTGSVYGFRSADLKKRDRALNPPVLVPLVGRGPWLWIAGAAWVLTLLKTGVDNVLGVSLRQRMTPDALLGRMNATFRFLLTGALAVGAAVSGLIGELAGVRATLWVGGALLAVNFLPVFLSPVRSRRELPHQRGTAAISRKVPR